MHWQRITIDSNGSVSLTLAKEPAMPSDAMYFEGFTAYQDGSPYSSNPYIRGTESWVLWADGWVEAENAYLDILEIP
jgi:hypothetical protein